jgi:hypothetical protein
MRAPLHALLLLSFVAVTRAGAQADSAGRTRGQANGDVALDSAAQSDSLRTRGFDMSHYLFKQKGFLPIPIIITEPQIGYGGGLAGIWFGEPPESPPGEERKIQTPAVTGAAAFYAGKSYGAGAGMYRPLHDDQMRYLGLVVGTSLGLRFFGFDPNAPLAANPLHYTFKLVGTQQRVQYRLRESPFYVGAQYLFGSTKSDFATDLVDRPVGVGSRDLKYTVSGAGLTGEFDTRDNFLDARRGQDVTMSLTFYGRELGGTTNFGKFKTEALLYEELDDQWSYAIRLDGRTAWGAVPFFDAPYVSLRGITAQQFSNNVAMMNEDEVTYTLAPRWSVVGFGGIGYSAPALYNLGNGFTSYAGGAGVRYLLATRLKLRTGVDLAWGTGSTSPAIYFQLGSAWR